MCGITGHISFQELPSPDHVAELVRRIRHRGPDDQGIWASPKRECVLGHARLSIIDLSPLGHQPMLDPDSGNAIVFNGEIYNFQILRKEREAAGDVFRTHSDTEVILTLYRRYGIDCLKFLRGMFAFVIWDERNQRIFFARDRVGKKPFNYTLSHGNFVFCSEIDPLSRHPLVSREMDLEALELYLQLQYIPAPWTIYTAIRKLPPAHYGLFDRNGLRLKKYWDVNYTQKINISEIDALDGLEEKLTEAIRLRMITDVPLGALLSGGVDSSVVVALMAKLSSGQVRTFSMGFREETFNELPFAQRAADICGTLHYPEIIEGNIEQELPKLARHYGEPFADHSAVASFEVCQAARHHVTVAMNGDGGDELLGGYWRYSIANHKLQLAPWLSHAIKSQSAVDLAIRLQRVESVPGKVLRKLLMEYVRPELRSILMYSSFWNDKERAALMSENGHVGLLPQWRSHWYSGACQQASNPVDRMLWYDSRTYLPGALLAKMDIAGMHCGLETRSPFLDHEVIEFCAHLPVQYKVHGGIGKYLLKKLAQRYYPIKFVDRRKMGFGIPLQSWLRGSLRGIVEDVLRDPSATCPLNNGPIEQILSDFYERKKDVSLMVWSVLLFGVWRRSCYS
ncbi:MAG: asparagine synthase (glutamine-hydrolyzing) [Desulfobulbaceae bacterium]|nr:asparagine synthase (glutamine-hydrolyzing) [Desulfobulbaceae bacterium]